MLEFGKKISKSQYTKFALTAVSVAGGVYLTGGANIVPLAVKWASASAAAHLYSNWLEATNKEKSEPAKNGVRILSGFVIGLVLGNYIPNFDYDDLRELFKTLPLERAANAGNSFAESFSKFGPTFYATEGIDVEVPVTIPLEAPTHIPETALAHYTATDGEGLTHMMKNSVGAPAGFPQTPHEFYTWAKENGIFGANGSPIIPRGSSGWFDTLGNYWVDLNDGSPPQIFVDRDGDVTEALLKLPRK